MSQRHRTARGAFAAEAGVACPRPQRAASNPCRAAECDERGLFGARPRGRPRARSGLEADASSRRGDRQEQARQAQPHEAALEDQDVEAAHPAASRACRADAPGTRPRRLRHLTVCGPGPVCGPGRPRPAVTGRRRPRLAINSCAPVVPFLDGDAVADVVLPHAVDLEVAQRDAFVADAQLLHDPATAFVARHDADLDAVESELFERELQHHHHGFGDVIPARRGPGRSSTRSCLIAWRRGRRC